MKPKYKRVLLKLSGEVLSGDKGHGFDFNVIEDEFLQYFMNLVQEWQNSENDGVDAFVWSRINYNQQKKKRRINYFFI